EAEAIASPKSVRVIPIDINDYAEERKLIKDLPKDTCLGIVSLSTGIIRIAEVLSYSLRGDDILVMTAQTEDAQKLSAVVRSAQTILADNASYPIIKEALLAARNDIIRPPEIIRCGNYIGEKSIGLLKRELGLD
ncbi:MAG: GntR family transcriptional regulator, partial [Cyanobacteria bacterium J06614_10]